MLHRQLYRPLLNRQQCHRCRRLRFLYYPACLSILRLFYLPWWCRYPLFGRCRHRADFVPNISGHCLWWHILSALWYCLSVVRMWEFLCILYLCFSVPPGLSAGQTWYKGQPVQTGFGMVWSNALVFHLYNLLSYIRDGREIPAGCGWIHYRYWKIRLICSGRRCE